MKLKGFFFSERGQDFYCYFLYEDEEGGGKSYDWWLQDIEKIEWKLKEPENVPESLKKEMEKKLERFKEKVNMLEQKENGIGSIQNIIEIKKERNNKISCKIQFNGMEGCLELNQICFQKGRMKYSYLNFLNIGAFVNFMFYHNPKWRKDFEKELYTNKNVRMFFLTS